MNLLQYDAKNPKFPRKLRAKVQQVWRPSRNSLIIKRLDQLKVHDRDPGAHPEPYDWKALYALLTDLYAPGTALWDEFLDALP